MNDETPTTMTSLARDRSAPRLARRWIAEQLNPVGLGPETHESIVLLVSELVTLVVQHTESDPVVALRVAPDQVLVGVENSMDFVSAYQARSGEDQSTAIALRVVDQIADSWGAREVTAGTSLVWFAIDTDPDHPPARR